MAELVKWDPQSIKDKITQSIRAAYLQFIPEEAWKSLVEAEIKSFTEDYRARVDDNYGRETYKDMPSPLKQMIKKELETILQGCLKVELEKPEYQEKWTNNGNGRYLPGEAVKKIIQDSSLSLVEALWGDIVQKAVMSLRNIR